VMYVDRCEARVAVEAGGCGMLEVCVAFPRTRAPGARGQETWGCELYFQYTPDKELSYKKLCSALARVAPTFHLLQIGDALLL
jgi:hypothetical protein